MLWNEQRSIKGKKRLNMHKVVLVLYNVANSDYQQDLRVFYTIILYKSFGQLLDISPKSFTFLKSLIHTFHTLNYGLLIKILNLWR